MNRLNNLTILVCIFLPRILFGQLTWQGGVPPEQNQSGILLFNATGTPLANATSTLYVHTGVTLNGQAWQNVVGSWGNNTSQPALTLVSPNQYRLEISPTIQAYYNITAGTINRINLVVRNAAGNVQTQDLSIQVGAFDMNLVSPAENSIQIWDSGNLTIQANHSGGAATYLLYSPVGTRVDSNANVASSYSFNLNQAENGTYRLVARVGSQSIERRFQLVLGQTPLAEAMPQGLKDGVNYFSEDATKAALVLNAPGKEFVYVAGNFNNWKPDANYSMKRDPATGKFWFMLQNLVAGEWYGFQYWVCDRTTILNSPQVVKTADPFSNLVFSSFDDPEINTLNVFPGLPPFQQIAPGQEREVTAVQTGPNAFWQYNWTSTTKPNRTIDKRDLMIYEVLIRDFDSQRTFQNLIDRFDYFKNLNVNAIQLMPVMEFEGNMSWGYNPVYHLALDKRYGPPAKLKEFVDLCHQNGIAVILDLALNHVFGRSPLERMWMIDTDNDGWSNGISPDNPYCNVRPRHTLNVGADLNHFREPDNLTNTYVIRTIEEWIKEYRIDGFRWDLTQGFTNACTENDGNCTGSNQADRITKLKWYTDKQWEIDPYFYVIFEHWVFGEIPEYTNYRRNENPSKGVICWRRGDEDYANILKGWNPSIAGITDATLRIQGNMESHDEERLVYKAISESGQTQGNLNKALARMPALGSMFFLVPGPKMIWHFAALGWNLTINTCSNGSTGNCRLDTKPQPQWTSDWMNVDNRKKIYDDWGKLMKMRTSLPVFKTGQHAFNQSVAGRPSLDIWTSTNPSPTLSYVMVRANFSNSPATFESFFPYVGTWYNLLDNTPITVTSTTQSITLPADGGYVVYGNQPNESLVSIEQLLDNKTGLSLQVFHSASGDSPVVRYFEPKGKQVSICIYSLDGRKIWEKNQLPAQGELELDVKIPVSHGVVQVKSDNGIRSAIFYK